MDSRTEFAGRIHFFEYLIIKQSSQIIKKCFTIFNRNNYTIRSINIIFSIYKRNRIFN
ncbi:unnamed protein product [Paramecium sonneborni]|uniref:Uncharacterized protein n=1 Tax=Paramecium sonneborni TaxID=65129 RepID=A0A8S1L1L8_9CILI|nr:unnamed protein product [Paramecium sonneborni]